MGFWQPLTTLKDFVTQNPPVVTFFICLLSLALSFIGFSLYGQTHTLPNPDIAQDWNHILSSLAQFELCVGLPSNVSSDDLVYPSTAPLMDHGATGMTSLSSTMKPHPVTQLHLKVPVVVTCSSTCQSLKDVGLHSTLVASQLGFKDNATVNVTLHLHSTSQPHGNDTYTCLTISAPKDILPSTILPPACPVNEKKISTVQVESVESYKKSPTTSRTCYSLQWNHDPTLTVMLTKDELRVAGRHLVEVGVCLLGICLMLCLSAILTHSSSHRYNENDLQREPLIDS